MNKREFHNNKLTSLESGIFDMNTALTMLCVSEAKRAGDESRREVGHDRMYCVENHEQNAMLMSFN